MFSGVLYPDYDFKGRKQQDIGNTNVELDIIAFCSAPMESGWGVLFAWHDSSNKACKEFIGSLADAVSENGIIQDFLFRLVLKCENHAIAPRWWESLSAEKKEVISESLSNDFDIFEQTSDLYLMKGLERITDWKFDEVITNTY